MDNVSILILLRWECFSSFDNSKKVKKARFFKNKRIVRLELWELNLLEEYVQRISKRFGIAQVFFSMYFAMERKKSNYYDNIKYI